MFQGRRKGSVRAGEISVKNGSENGVGPRWGPGEKEVGGQAKIE